MNAQRQSPLQPQSLGLCGMQRCHSLEEISGAINVPFSKYKRDRLIIARYVHHLGFQEKRQVSVFFVTS